MIIEGNFIVKKEYGDDEEVIKETVYSALTHEVLASYDGKGIYTNDFYFLLKTDSKKEEYTVFNDKGESLLTITKAQFDKIDFYIYEPVILVDGEDESDGFIYDIENKRYILKSFKGYAYDAYSYYEDGLTYYEVEDDDKIKYYIYNPLNGEVLSLPEEDEVIDINTNTFIYRKAKDHYVYNPKTNEEIKFDRYFEDSSEARNYFSSKLLYFDGIFYLLEEDEIKKLNKDGTFETYKEGKFEIKYTLYGYRFIEEISVKEKEEGVTIYKNAYVVYDAKFKKIAQVNEERHAKMGKYIYAKDSKGEIIIYDSNYKQLTSPGEYEPMFFYDGYNDWLMG